MLIAVLSISFVFLWMYIKRAFVFRQDNVIAYRVSGLDFLILIPLILDVVVLIGLLENRHYSHDSMLSKRRLKKRTSKEIRNRKQYTFTIVAIIIGVLINLMFCAFPIYSRTVLTQNGDIIKYTIFNAEKEHVIDSQYNSVDLEISYIHAGVRTSDKYVLTIIVHAGKDDYCFNSGDFCNIDIMLDYLNALDKDIISFIGAEYFDVYIQSHNFSLVQTTKLKALLNK